MTAKRVKSTKMSPPERREATLCKAGMGTAAVKAAIVRAVEQLLEKDADLLILDANERSLTHQLAVHLIREFEGWDVDCEYNRDHHDSKRLALSKTEGFTSNADDATTVFPDVIVHQRDTDNNLVVIEAKKTTGSKDHAWDMQKLDAFRDQLGYAVTVFVLLETGKKSSVTATLTLCDGAEVVHLPALAGQPKTVSIS